VKDHNMKTFLSIIILVAAIAPEMIWAQGVTYVSNLGAVSNGSQPIGSNSWFAAPFRTGTNGGGYQINSIHLLMDQPSGNPGGFSLSLYDLSGNVPGNSVGMLAGLEPASPGVFTFSSLGIVLPPSGYYFIVATADRTVSEGAYMWKTESGAGTFYNSGWILGAGLYSSNDGFDWTINRVSVFQFAINATAVPEPSSLLLFFGGLLFGANLLRRQI